MEPESQRYLAAAMLVDMVGYTAASQRNETLALELVDKLAQALRPIFVKHSGREIDHGRRPEGRPSCHSLAEVRPRL